jgi:hypothetical protein
MSILLGNRSNISRRPQDDAIRQIDLGFLLVLNARRPRISHRYRDIAVRRWTGSGFGHTVTSQTGTTTPFDRSTSVSYSAQCTPTSYLAPLPRYSGSKVDRKRFRPYGDVTDRKRRRHSIDRPRFPIGAQCTPTSYLAPLPRYSGSKVDRKRFRPYGDVTDRKRRRHSIDRPRFPIRRSMHADLVSRTVTEI